MPSVRRPEQWWPPCRRDRPHRLPRPAVLPLLLPPGPTGRVWANHGPTNRVGAVPIRPGQKLLDSQGNSSLSQQAVSPPLPDCERSMNRSPVADPAASPSPCRIPVDRRLTAGKRPGSGPGRLWDMGRVRVAACQINTVVGDLEGNAARILDALAEAEGGRADLAVFPELTVTGYPPEDLLMPPGVRGRQPGRVRSDRHRHRTVRRRHRLCRH